MKQHLSVLMLAARSTVYKLLGLLLVMAAVEGALFYLVLNRLLHGELISLEQVVNQSRMPLVCGVCFLLLCVMLSLTGCEYSGSKLQYTIKRLSVREETTVLWWAVYNTVCFLAFWAVQLLIAVLLCRLYVAKVDPVSVSGQTIFLAFYRDKFLHSLLPLEEISRYIRNALLICGLGASAACFSFRQRHGQKGIAIVALAAVTLGYFSRPMGSFGSDLVMAIMAVAVAAVAIAGIWGERVDEEEA